MEKEPRLKNIIIIILLGLSIFTALIMETKMRTNASFELIFILAGILFFTSIIFGMWIDAQWTYPSASIMFAASLANMLWTFTLTKDFLTFAFGILVGVAGLVICIISKPLAMPPDPQLETYDIDEELKQLRLERAALKKKNKPRKK